MDRQRFCQLWIRNLDPGVSDDSSAVFELLAANYSHPKRNYHDGRHIEGCLEWFDRYRDLAADPDALELALWFHDVSYSGNPAGHEQRGAALVRQLLTARMDAARLDSICSMILQTDHRQPPEDAEHALVVDIDLASFARPWATYLRDTARCRAEMRSLAKSDYCACQLNFLRCLHSRDAVYHHPRFRADNEQAAQSNITRLIELLEARAAAGQPDALC